MYVERATSSHMSCVKNRFLSVGKGTKKRGEPAENNNDNNKNNGRTRGCYIRRSSSRSRDRARSRARPRRRRERRDNKIKRSSSVFTRARYLFVCTVRTTIKYIRKSVQHVLYGSCVPRAYARPKSARDKSENGFRSRGRPFSPSGPLVVPWPRAGFSHGSRPRTPVTTLFTGAHVININRRRSCATR